jgi:outer membrane receptor protein involved in Fe transport
MENINYNPTIGPERSGVAELEVGKVLSSKSLLVLNFYDIRIDDPLVYYFSDAFPAGNYINYGSTGTRGLEVEYRYKMKRSYLVANYAFYSAAGLNDVPIYVVPGKPEALLAWPQHKLNAFGSWSINERFSLNPSVSFVSTRHAVTNYNEGADEIEYGTIEGKLYINLFAQYKTGNLEFGLGVFDVTNQVQDFIQPYDGWTAPMRGVGRELVLRLSHKIF